jgi:hypothetical protein
MVDADNHRDGDFFDQVVSFNILSDGLWFHPYFSFNEIWDLLTKDFPG